MRESHNLALAEDYREVLELITEVEEAWKEASASLGIEAIGR